MSSLEGSGRALALFDFDGTLTTHELFPDFIRHAADPLRIRRGRIRLAPLLLGYRLRMVGACRVRAAVVDAAFRGMPESQFNARAMAFAHDVIPTLLRAEAMQRLDEHRRRGDRIVVVSGNFEACLSPWCEAQHIECLASRLEVEHGRLTGRYRGAQCVGAEKARRVRELCRGEDYATIYAYGDTPEDAELLALADVAWYRGKPITPLSTAREAKG